MLQALGKVALPTSAPGIPPPAPVPPLIYPKPLVREAAMVNDAPRLARDVAEAMPEPEPVHRRVGTTSDVDDDDEEKLIELQVSLYAPFFCVQLTKRLFRKSTIA
jgi:hypothetical protein